MLELLTWLEASALGQNLRGAGVWTYGLLNLGHIAGISTLFGSLLILDLRLIGVWKSVALPTLVRPTVPLAIIGFAIAAVSGFCMLTFNASEYYANPFLLIKFPAIAFGLVNALVVSRLPAWKEMQVREPGQSDRLKLRIGGAASLAFWSVALGAGRMIGYW